MARCKSAEDRRIKILRNCLATAEIIYRLPDYPDLLQTYIWQDTDLAPHLPALKRFLEFWECNLEGRLHSVTVSARRLVRPMELVYAGAEFRLH